MEDLTLPVGKVNIEIKAAKNAFFVDTLNPHSLFLPEPCISDQKNIRQILMMNFYIAK